MANRIPKMPDTLFGEFMRRIVRFGPIAFPGVGALYFMSTMRDRQAPYTEVYPEAMVNNEMPADAKMSGVRGILDNLSSEEPETGKLLFDRTQGYSARDQRRKPLDRVQPKDMSVDQFMSLAVRQDS